VEPHCRAKLSAAPLGWRRNPLAEAAVEVRTCWLPSTEAWRSDDPQAGAQSAEMRCFWAELIPWEEVAAALGHFADRGQLVEVRRALADWGTES
jgi:hypothetical protein